GAYSRTTFGNRARHQPYHRTRYLGQRRLHAGRESFAGRTKKLGQLVQAGVFGTRAEAAAFLIDEGIRVQGPLFERVEQKLAEIERLRAELRGLVGEKKDAA